MNFCNLPRGLCNHTPDDRVSGNKRDYSLLAGIFESGGGRGRVGKVRVIALLKRFTRNFRGRR